MLSLNTVSVIDQTSSLKRKTLFDDQQEQGLMACAESAAGTMKDPPQPHFQSKLLNSPFYSGLTMYGGASSSIYINEPNIKHRKMTYVYETKDDDSVNLSTSTRRVMDLLENYSSPLVNARRIPRYELSKLTKVNRSLPDPYTSTRNAFKTQELYIPSTASVIRMKARCRLMDSTKAARQIIASHSSTLSFRGFDSINRDEWSEPGFGKSQSKLKAHLTRTNRGDTFSMPESFELPKAVLQIDVKNLPKFTFEKSVSKTSSNPPSTEIFKFSTPLPVNLDKKTVSLPSHAYDFGIPDKAAANISPPKFSFGNNNSHAITDNKPLMQSESKEQSVITFAKATTKLHEWKCPECWVSNNKDKKKCVCCGAKKVSKNKGPKASETTAKLSTRKIANRHTSSDKCVNCEKLAATPKKTADQLSVANKTSTKWKCPECWIENDESKDNCVCCGSSKSKPAVVVDKAVVVPTAAKAGDDERVSCDEKWKCCDCLLENDDSTDECVCCGTRKSAKSIAVTANISDKVDVVTSAATKDWRCDDCLITNKASIDKCAACGGAKPGTKPAAKPAVKTLPTFSSSNFFKKPDSKLAEIVKAQKLSWECRVCLANNANDKTACLCCDTAKDAKDTSSPKFSNFKFDVEPNLGFKFGIDLKYYEKHSTKTVYETLPSKMDESERNNNDISESPILTFPLPANNKDYKFDGPKTNEEPKPSFSFGIPKQSYASANKNFSDIKFPNILKPVEGTEKSQEAPSISLKSPETAKPLTGLLTAPAPTANPLNAMNEFLNYSSEIKPVSPNKEITKPLFSFSAAKPSSDMFSLPASAAATSSLTTQDTVTQPPMLGMFGKTDATVQSPAVSFFSKSDNSTQAPFSFQDNIDMNAAPGTLATATQSAAAAKPVAAAPAAPPLFSFGSNQSTNSTSAPSEHNKFNFVFSTSTPMFGATPQHNSSAFGLTTNPLSNAPASSPMGITSNPLGGGMSSKSLGSATPMFNAPQKKNTNMWPNTSEQTNQVNPFVSTPAEPQFTFGAAPSPSPFGTPVNNIAPIVFGATSQPAQNMFGMNQNNTSQPPMFPNPAPTQQPSSMFGNSTLPMFGVQNASPFGAPTPSMTTFEAPAPTSAFNFGAPQSSPAVFGFGQQPANTMQGMQGMQGMQTAGIGQMQFSIGTAPQVAAGRRVRKAVRRMPPR